jgi:hypothetical protein
MKYNWTGFEWAGLTVIEGEGHPFEHVWWGSCVFCNRRHEAATIPTALLHNVFAYSIKHLEITTIMSGRR